MRFNQTSCRMVTSLLASQRKAYTRSYVPHLIKYSVIGQHSFYPPTRYSHSTAVKPLISSTNILNSPHSPLPDTPDSLLYDFVSDGFEKFGDKTAIVSHGRQRLYNHFSPNHPS